jgi:two-component system, NtrC family, response regulator HydG
MGQVSGLSQRLRRKAASKNTLIGAAPAMLELYRQIAQVAPTDVTVLIIGERGSGKELVARTIHERSRRTARACVAVNCAGLAEQALESELFGHERGAIPGAHSARAGLFEEANGGTVFLDEVGDVPIKMQARLLRVLQEGEVCRVGGSKPIAVDVRLLAATNRELSIDVAQKRLRPDLFYRLNVVTIRIPPLRDRGEDIVALARHFVARDAVALGRPVPEISRETLDELRSYPWPGNVGELENAMLRAVEMSQNSVLRPADLPPLVSDPQTIDRDWPTLAELERRYINRVLERTGGNKTQAAAILGVARRTLQRQEREQD